MLANTPAPQKVPKEPAVRISDEDSGENLSSGWNTPAIALASKPKTTYELKTWSCQGTLPQAATLGQTQMRVFSYRAAIPEFGSRLSDDLSGPLHRADPDSNSVVHQTVPGR